jgi:SAM-dependent methyltransferase
MTQRADPKEFWEDKILEWEGSRYGGSLPNVTEGLAGKVSSSLRFRLQAALAILGPQVRGRRVVELGCGSGLLAEALITAGAVGYQGYDISEKAIANAKTRLAASPAADRITFTVSRTEALGPQSDAVVLSLGLFDWLTPQEISHVLSIGRQGSYFHAVAEKRHSLQQWIHRAYVHVAYGHRTGGYVPQYHSMKQIVGLAAGVGLPPPNVYRDPRMSFGIFVSSLPLPEGRIRLD